MTRLIPLLILAGLVAEIASIIWVGRMLGVLPAVLLLFAGGLIGVKLLKSAGTSVVEAFRSPIQSSSAMGGVGSVAVTRMFAGLLFLIPGFFSDILALFVLLPAVQRWVQARFHVQTFSTDGARPSEPFGGSPFGTVIEGEAVEIVGEIEPAPSASKQTS